MSTALRDMDGCLNSLRVGMGLWESVSLFHFGYYRNVNWRTEVFYNAYSYTGYYRKVIDIEKYRLLQKSYWHRHCPL